MIPHTTPSSYATKQNSYALKGAGAPFFAQRTQEERLARHWICSGCETAYAGTLPEECENCGATALEFEYCAPRTPTHLSD
jgi:hypothetical protein